MIPIEILSVLHYVSVAAAVAMLALIGWHYFWPRSDKE